jgi:segregation and condensation protein B
MKATDRIDVDAEPAEPEGAGAPLALEPPALNKRLDGIVESLLFAAGAPIPLRRLVQVLDGPPVAEVKAALGRLMEAYGSGERGIRLQQVAGGYQLRTAPENAEWVRTLLRERPPRLGRAALETLAVVAYRQPATRVEIERIRGVDADSALNTLLTKRLIRVAGRKEAPGRPLMYATTPEFLEVFGLNDLGELPTLKELGPVAEHEDEINEEEHGRTVAEDPEPGGHRLAARGGRDDPGGPGAGERPHGDGAGSEGGPEP